MRKPLLLLAILAALIWTDASYGDPTSLIAFVSKRGGDNDIYVMNANGSDPHRVANTGWHDIIPCWSPDGSRIIYGSWTGDGSIWMVNRDGSENTRIRISGLGASTRSSVDWSRDGNYYVFSGLVGSGTDEIVVVSVSTLELAPVLFPADDHKPDWSPDGSKIAFDSYREGDGAGGKMNIWVMEADGFNPIRLTDSSADDAAAWSPDGTQIAFASNRTGDWEIWLMNADGSNPVQITDSPDMDRDPTWSPDGTQIAFSSRRDGNWEVYAMNADGSNQTNLSNHPTADLNPDWSPNIEQPVTLIEALSWGWIKAGAR